MWDWRAGDIVMMRGFSFRRFGRCCCCGCFLGDDGCDGSCGGV